MTAVRQGEHAFFGTGRVDVSKIRGTLRIVDPSLVRGGRIESSGFGVEVRVVDKKVVSLALTASFKIDRESTDWNVSRTESLIYSSQI